MKKFCTLFIVFFSLSCSKPEPIDVKKLCQEVVEKFNSNKGLAYNYSLVDNNRSISGEIVAELDMNSEPFIFKNFKLHVNSEDDFELFKLGNNIHYSDNKESILSASLLRNGALLFSQKIGYNSLLLQYFILISNSDIYEPQLGEQIKESHGKIQEVIFSVPDENFKAIFWINIDKKEIDKIVAFDNEGSEIVYQISNLEWLNTFESKTFELQGSKELIEFSVGGPLIGDSLSDLVLNTYDGNQISISDYKGKILVLDFWATWCAPCVSALPKIQKLYDDYKLKGVEVIGATYKEKNDAVSFALEKGITYSIANGDVAEERLALDSTGLPIIFILDKKGSLLEYIIGDQGEKGDRFIRSVIEKELQ